MLVKLFFVLMFPDLIKMLFWLKLRGKKAFSSIRKGRIKQLN